MGFAVFEVHVDASDFEHLAKAIVRLPGAIKTKATARAMSRVIKMARTRIVRRSAERVDLPPSVVAKLTTARFNAGGNTADVVMRANWVGLFKLGARQTRTGVSVRGRGSYAHAFIAKMGSGHQGVFMREGEGSPRFPIRELFGPNPSHDVTNNPEVFMQVLAQVIEEHLLPRYLHEVDNLLRM